jgi:hypothetical protein
MNYQKAQDLLQAVETSALEELRADLLKAAVRYAHMRAEWQLASFEERVTMDASRARAHEALIIACNVLSRNMAAQGENATWRAALGDNRKVIGDFACLVHAILGIRAG